jgi:hypothetical protein
MTTKKDVKRSTYDELVRRGVESGLTVKKAEKQASDSCERVNRERKGGK